MREETCSRISELLEAYVVGGLDEEQRREVELHLRACPECRREADELTEAAHALPYALATAAQTRLPSELKRRVLAAVGARSHEPSKPARRRLRVWLRPSVVGAVVFVAVAAVSLAWNAHLSDALSQERSIRARLADLVGRQEIVLEVVDSRKTVRAFLQPPAASRSDAYGKLFTRPDLPYAVVMAARLPKRPASVGYRVVLTSGGRTSRAGDLVVNEDGFGLLVVKTPRRGPVYDGARVTLRGRTVLVWRASGDA